MKTWKTTGRNVTPVEYISMHLFYVGVRGDSDRAVVALVKAVILITVLLSRSLSQLNKHHLCKHDFYLLCQHFSFLLSLCFDLLFFLDQSLFFFSFFPTSLVATPARVIFSVFPFEATKGCGISQILARCLLTSQWK